MNNGLLYPLLDNEGPWLLLAEVSAYAVMERESSTIEPIDLIKAIYIVDLEHVMKFWDDWEGLERLVSNLPGNKQPKVYINRMSYLIYLDEVKRQAKPGEISLLGKPSQGFMEILTAARATASEREGSPATPSSRDLLFCICGHDLELREELLKSGLQIENLESAVRLK